MRRWRSGAGGVWARGRRGRRDPPGQGRSRRAQARLAQPDVRGRHLGHRRRRGRRLGARRPRADRHRASTPRRSSRSASRSRSPRAGTAGSRSRMTRSGCSARAAGRCASPGATERARDVLAADRALADDAPLARPAQVDHRRGHAGQLAAVEHEVRARRGCVSGTSSSRRASGPPARFALDCSTGRPTGREERHAQPERLRVGRARQREAPLGVGQQQRHAARQQAAEVARLRGRRTSPPRASRAGGP